MEEDRIKWDRKYRETEFFFTLAPSRFLSQCFERVAGLLPGRRALDIACGEGRNALFLAQRGFEVDAVDISEEGLAKGRKRAEREGVGVNFVQADLDHYRLEAEYDLILNFNFLLRPLLSEAVAHLTPGGVLVLETIMDGPDLEEGHKKSFLLQPGELERLMLPLGGSMLLLEEFPLEPMPVARCIFRKG